MMTLQFVLLCLLGVASARNKPRADVGATSCVLATTLPLITVTRRDESTSVLTESPPEPTTYVYVTEYGSVCSTGIVTQTYTVTKTCEAAPCTYTEGEVPAGFTVTVATCTACGDTPVTATLTGPKKTSTTTSAGGSSGSTPSAGKATGPVPSETAKTTLAPVATTASGPPATVVASSGMKTAASLGVGVVFFAAGLLWL